MTSVVPEVKYVIPGTAAWPDPVGVSWTMGYGVYGRLPERSTEDVVRSVRKHFAELLLEVAGGYLAEGDTGWEVRGWDEKGTFAFPFARVTAVGPNTIVGSPRYADVTQSMTVHLYPHPAQDAEGLILSLDRLRGVVETALTFGAGRGKGWRIPLWDFAASPDLYDDTEARQPTDYMKVEGLTTERFLDPEDDREGAVIVNFRAQWRRVPSGVPGLLVSSVRVRAHPS